MVQEQVREKSFRSGWLFWVQKPDGGKGQSFMEASEKPLRIRTRSQIFLHQGSHVHEEGRWGGQVVREAENTELASSGTDSEACWLPSQLGSCNAPILSER